VQDPGHDDHRGQGAAAVPVLHRRDSIGQRDARVAETGITWNYTTILNIIFLLLAAALLVRFFTSGGGPMLKMMGGPAPHERQADPDPERNAPCAAQPAYPPAGSLQESRPRGPA